MSLAFALILINKLKFCKLEVDHPDFFIFGWNCFWRWEQFSWERMGDLIENADLPGSGPAVIKSTEAAKDNWLYYQDARVGFVVCPRSLYGSSGELHCIGKYSSYWGHVPLKPCEKRTVNFLDRRFQLFCGVRWNLVMETPLRKFSGTAFCCFCGLCFNSLLKDVTSLKLHWGELRKCSW